MERTAEELAREQREISISEFFEKNRHLLGYDNKIKALLMIVKEAVDNSLDACEEARILPEIYVKLEEVSPDVYRIQIRDNGPGIVKKHIPRIFGTLLYGSKFHRLRQSRGAQGLGISCAVLYSQLTTGEPVEILSSTGDGTTHRYKLKIDIKRNQPQILEEESLDLGQWHGVQITFLAEGKYKEHKQSVLEYLKETAIANPYAHIIFDSPTGRVEFPRGSEELPREPKAIKPHLHGVELGVLERMLMTTKARTLLSFFTTEFSRVGATTAKQICEKAGVDPRISPKRVEDEQVKKLMAVIKETKLIAPPTDVLSPLGAQLIEEGLRKELSPEFVVAVTRPPAVYRGFPFQVEVGLAYGGEIQETRLYRFANRVPLLYKQGDCAITKAVETLDWRRYGILGDMQLGKPGVPLAIFAHICSVWVPFTSESKEAVASYPVILKELKLALQEAARKLSIWLSGKRRAEYQAQRLKTFEKYAEETAKAIAELVGEPEERVKELLVNIIRRGKNGGETEREAEAAGASGA
ncbi:MAG: DNA topoisomerase VI subunit B [Candidatus Aenigmatarchaeota archaeon]|nr:MAG: DNA topoisomerase VI subunit B [Candidatus Aenigmarchaeota archaeon]